jgi:PPP family 3-phenylpropionic acid transporter
VLTAYLPLWMADRGLSAAAIGQVLGLASLMRVVAGPAWGWAADRLGRPLVTLFVAGSCAALCMAALPAASGPLPILVLVVVGGVASSAMAPLADAVTLTLAASKRLEYGRTRAWGSIAYMLASAGAGALLGQAGSRVVPYLLALGYGVAAVLTAGLPSVRPAAGAGTIGAKVLPPAFGSALLATALIQGSHAAYYAFATLHWRGLGISDQVIGLLFAEGIVAEIALFLWGRELIERLGPAGLTAVAAGCCVLRWTVTALTGSVAVLLAAQLLHAGTFACQHLSSTLVLRGLLPGRAGVAQSVMAALGFAAPTGLLIWVSGQVYGQAGGMVFLLMAVIGGAALAVVPRLPAAARPR